MSNNADIIREMQRACRIQSSDPWSTCDDVVKATHVAYEKAKQSIHEGCPMVPLRVVAFSLRGQALVFDVPDVITNNKPLLSHYINHIVRVGPGVNGFIFVHEAYMMFVEDEEALQKYQEAQANNQRIADMEGRIEIISASGICVVRNKLYNYAEIGKIEPNTRRVSDLRKTWSDTSAGNLIPDMQHFVPLEDEPPQIKSNSAHTAKRWKT